MKNRLILVLSILGIAYLYNFYHTTSIKDNKKLVSISERTFNKANEIKTFLKSNTKYNKDVIFLLDMKIPSNKYRFFVFDIKKNTVTDFGLVAHGSGSATKTDELKFSNTDGSLMTSLGKYYIGNSYNGTFGKAYKMYGLDTTNSNAFKRNIVLHAYDKMPYKEQISPICLSWGCPMVNEIFYKRLQEIIDTSDKKILLYIYY
jgi:hypothetical protein